MRRAGIVAAAVDHIGTAAAAIARGATVVGVAECAATIYLEPSAVSLASSVIIAFDVAAAVIGVVAVSTVPYPSSPIPWNCSILLRAF